MGIRIYLSGSDKGNAGRWKGNTKETDRAAVVFMDERFGWKKYAGAFDSGDRFVVTDEPERHVKFWSGTQ